MPTHPLTIHYRGHVIRERYIGEGIYRYTIDGHGHGTVTASLNSPAACRNAIDDCVRSSRPCAAGREYEESVA